MSHQDWISLFAPAVAALALAAATIAGAVVTGLGAKVSAWLTAKGNATTAQAVAAASAVIQPALMTGASTIAGKIARGELDYTNRDALAAEAVREVGLVQLRVPAMLAVAAPAVADLVASMVAKVDAAMVASPTPLAGQFLAGGGTVT